MATKDFRFEDALAEYISQVKQTAPLGASDEAELRGHLLDASEELQTLGLNAEESFIIAAKRMGNASEVGNEYRKVNAGLVTDQIWAYMLMGFCIVSSLIWLYGILSGNLQLYMVRHFMDEPVWINTVLSCFNILVCIAIWSVLSWGRRFSAWIQRVIRQRPWVVAKFMIIVGSFPLMLSPVLRRLNPELFNPHRYLAPSQHLLHNNFAYYLVLISASMVTLLSVFSISIVRRVSAKSLFVSPSYLFVYIFGFATEIIAAMTRTFHLNIALNAFVFGLIYAAGSFLISYYNSSRNALYVCIFASIGFILEMWVGIVADISRGGTFYTAYFVSALITGVLIGHGLATWWKKITKVITTQ